MAGLREAKPQMRDLEMRAQGEYLEMPGQRLTVPQASKLWAVDAKVAGVVLERLVQRKFLRHVGPYYFRADLGVNV